MISLLDIKEKKIVWNSHLNTWKLLSITDKFIILIKNIVKEASKVKEDTKSKCEAFTALTFINITTSKVEKNIMLDPCPEKARFISFIDQRLYVHRVPHLGGSFENIIIPPSLITKLSIYDINKLPNESSYTSIDIKILKIRRELNFNNIKLLVTPSKNQWITLSNKSNQIETEKFDVEKYTNCRKQQMTAYNKALVPEYEIVSDDILAFAKPFIYFFPVDFIDYEKKLKFCNEIQKKNPNDTNYSSVDKMMATHFQDLEKSLYTCILDDKGSVKYTYKLSNVEPSISINDFIKVTDNQKFGVLYHKMKSESKGRLYIIDFINQKHHVLKAYSCPKKLYIKDDIIVYESAIINTIFLQLHFFDLKSLYNKSPSSSTLKNYEVTYSKYEECGCDPIMESVNTFFHDGVFHVVTNNMFSSRKIIFDGKPEIEHWNIVNESLAVPDTDDEELNI